MQHQSPCSPVFEVATRRMYPRCNHLSAELRTTGTCGAASCTWRSNTRQVPLPWEYYFMPCKLQVKNLIVDGKTYAIEKMHTSCLGVGLKRLLLFECNLSQITFSMPALYSWTADLAKIGCHSGRTSLSILCGSWAILVIIFAHQFLNVQLGHVRVESF